MYLASYFLQHPPLNAAAKEELAALIMSLIIVGAWFFFQGILWQGACRLVMIDDLQADCGATSLAKSLSPTHLGIAYASLELLFQELKSIYVSLYLFEMLIGFLSTIYISAGTFNPLLAVLPISVPPLVGLSLLSNAHTVLVEAIGMVMVAIVSKQHLIQFATYVIPTILLPLGLVMRAFPMLRSTGSSIIAICIVAYFVYPLSIMLSNYLIFDVYKPVDMVYVPTAIGFCAANGDPTAEEHALKTKTDMLVKLREKWEKISNEPTSGVMANYGTTPDSSTSTKIVGFFESIWENVTGVLTTAKDIFKFMVKLFGDFGISLTSLLWGVGPATGVVQGLYYFIVEEVVIVSQFIILVIVTSVFEIIITITMYRNISAIIGGEQEIIGITKLV